MTQFIKENKIIFHPNIDMEATVFTELSLEDKKRFLMEMLDKNQLYVNYCDIDDEVFAVSEEDKAFTKSCLKISSNIFI